MLLRRIGDFPYRFYQRRTIRRTNKFTNITLNDINVTTIRDARKIVTGIPRNNAIKNSNVPSTKRLYRGEQRTNRQTTYNKRRRRTVLCDTNGNLANNGNSLIIPI